MWTQAKLGSQLMEVKISMLKGALFDYNLEEGFQTFINTLSDISILLWCLDLTLWWI